MYIWGTSLGRTCPKLGSATELRGTHPIFVSSKNRGVPHISLVFREIWDTTTLHLFLSKVGKKVKVRGIPHLAKNERDVGHPTLCGRDKDGMGHRNLAAT